MSAGRSGSWAIYGAYGYTGRLIAEAAVAAGERPVLAGRDAGRLGTVAAELGLEARPFGLEEPARLAREVGRFDLVLHAAGPFVRTSAPMVRACLEAGAHYLDITGEIPVLEAIYARHGEARAAGVALLPAVGFDVVPTDCLAAWVAARVGAPVELEIAIAPSGRASAGTTKTLLAALARRGSLGLARRGGRLVERRIGETRRVLFSDGREREALAGIPWGDLASAYRTTGARDITVLMASRPMARLAGVAPVLGRLLAAPPILQLAEAAVGRWVGGPDERARREGRSLLWARAEDAEGRSAEGWMETAEGYRFTALAAVECARRVLAAGPSGALTPAGAFGPDLALAVAGTRRLERGEVAGA
ncbi:MAG TPA: saccharopine dehydrogenase NADP-binding domain-containing protein [Gemmatimonadota bacterium]|nr:saccharopine dehydrogenase NADP-binding domain-containing protein [Gemmatimonadota bacterium]